MNMKITLADAHFLNLVALGSPDLVARQLNGMATGMFAVPTGACNRLSDQYEGMSTEPLIKRPTRTTGQIFERFGELPRLVDADGYAADNAKAAELLTMQQRAFAGLNTAPKTLLEVRAFASGALLTEGGSIILGGGTSMMIPAEAEQTTPADKQKTDQAEGRYPYLFTKDLEAVRFGDENCYEIARVTMMDLDGLIRLYRHRGNAVTRQALFGRQEKKSHWNLLEKLAKMGLCIIDELKRDRVRLTKTYEIADKGIDFIEALEENMDLTNSHQQEVLGVITHQRFPKVGGLVLNILQAHSGIDIEELYGLFDVESLQKHHFKTRTLVSLADLGLIRLDQDGRYHITSEGQEAYEAWIYLAKALAKIS